MVLFPFLSGVGLEVQGAINNPDSPPPLVWDQLRNKTQEIDEHLKVNFMVDTN